MSEPTTPPRPDPTIEALLDRLENFYDFQCTGGPLKMIVEWQQLRDLLAGRSPRQVASWLAEKQE